jgi:hypothetical protein
MKGCRDGGTQGDCSGAVMWLPHDSILFSFLIGFRYSEPDSGVQWGGNLATKNKHVNKKNHYHLDCFCLVLAVSLHKAAAGYKTLH